MPPSYWVEALGVATYLLNILPTKTLGFATPHFALHRVSPTYNHLRVFGCACYPNLAATAAHKLAPGSTLCVFLSYSAHHKGYRCLDRSTNRVIISRHVSFDEGSFPFAEPSRPPREADFEFLDDVTTNVPAPIGSSRLLSPADLLATLLCSHARSPAPPAAPRASRRAPRLCPGRHLGSRRFLLTSSTAQPAILRRRS